MALATELLEVLACPRCRGALIVPLALDEIHCERCRVAYRVEGGIPVLLVEEARPLP